ncbi:MAG: hypothetical protein DI582_00520 [Azospirillum brasilense]|nr:MAG: hypothetical protein DI582_00520 [Azospirillum brasilense]
MSTPALAMSANKELNRDASNPMPGSGAIEPLNDMRTASGSQQLIGIEGTALRTQNDPHTTIGLLGVAAARAIAYARNAAAAFTSLRRQSTPALAIAAA